MWPLVFAHVPALFLADTFSLSLSLSLCVCVCCGLKALRGYYSGISEVLGVLGLSSENYGEVLAGMKTCALGRCNRTAKDVERLIEERKEARANKDFEKSDKIREDLTSDGIALLDTPQGTEWRPVSMV